MTSTPARHTSMPGDGVDPVDAVGGPGTRGSAVRVLRRLALFSSGLLAGAFGYGAVNIVQAFQSVPLDVRLTFHTALMRMNGPVMQSAMGVAFVSALVLAVLFRARSRMLAAGAGLLTLATFLITRFGNVPINRQIREWLAGSVPADHAAILQRWELLNYLRTGTALTAFVLMLVVVDRTVGTTAGRQVER
ncbi:anthrone oxygenase family protein [Plantactinospora sp. WMMB782]|uniref:anthrone oxygenase family protein n=1 Tax=Plantactinospora sp. WMMB782 TaxID=3404121 RepID=UPI003B934AF6